MIVDCHTHWGVVWERATPGDARAWLDVLDRHEVDRAVVMGHAGLVREAHCASGNDCLARLRDRYPSRLLPAGTAWPQAGKEGVEEARRCLTRLGMKALKLHPWLQGFSTADPWLEEICEVAAEVDAPVIFHDGTPPHSLPEQLAGLARRHPRARIVLGHSGLHWHWRSALQAARQKNVWLCLCGPTRRAVELLCREAPAERLVWGSDFGFGLVDRQGYFLDLFRGSAVPAQLREAILGANALRLLGLAGGAALD